MKYGTFRYDTAEVEGGLNQSNSLFPTASVQTQITKRFVISVCTQAIFPMDRVASSGLVVLTQALKAQER